MFNAEDIDAFCDYGVYFLSRGAHEQIFCPSVQFASRWRRFRTQMQELLEGAGETKVFEKEQTLFFYSLEHGLYL